MYRFEEILKAIKNNNVTDFMENQMRQDIQNAELTFIKKTNDNKGGLKNE